jgi:hypothetical protein
VQLSSTAFAQGKSKANTPNYSQQVQTLTNLKVVQDAFAIIDKLESVTWLENGANYRLLFDAFLMPLQYNSQTS